MQRLFTASGTSVRGADEAAASRAREATAAAAEKRKLEEQQAEEERQRRSGARGPRSLLSAVGGFLGFDSAGKGTLGG